MINTVVASEYGYLTAEIDGLGGVIKEVPEDFCVFEIPAYEPCGDGEHLYLTIEKRGITTLEAVRRIAQELKVPEKEIGYAGMKDAVGVTRQTISLQRVKAETLTGKSFGDIKVVSAIRHGNKLKLGHLKGNRFLIKVRHMSNVSIDRVQKTMDVLISRGVPNWFGYQRYGIHFNSHLIGRAMLRRDWREAVDRLIGTEASVNDEKWKAAISAYHEGDFSTAAKLMPRHCMTEREVLQRLVSRGHDYEKAFAAVNPRLKKLYLSAFQSSLFDSVVNSRLTELDTIRQGDLAWKHLNGACFLVEDVAAEAERAASFEISATGPMFGSKMKQPQGETLLQEQKILDAFDLKPDAFDLGSGMRLEGERRPLRVPIGEPSFRLENDCLLLEFNLPKGSYATSVVREFTKNF